MSRYEEFARTYLHVVNDGGDELSCICPFHNDSTPSFRFNVRRGLWVCLGCGERGNIYQLAEKLGVPVLDAGVSSNDIRRRLRMMRKRSGVDNKDDRLRMEEKDLKQFVRHPYWTDTRGLTQHVVEQFGLCYDDVTDRAVIPLRNSYGNLLGVIYRRVDDGRPKYLYPRGFARGRSLYASWMVRKSSRTRVALVEGPVDALSCWSASVPAVALLGSSLADGQIKLLQSLGVRTVVTLLDNDKAGEDGTNQVVHALRGSGIRVHIGKYGGDGEDPGMSSRADLKNAWEFGLTSRR